MRLVELINQYRVEPTIHARGSPRAAFSRIYLSEISSLSAKCFASLFSTRLLINCPMHRAVSRMQKGSSSISISSSGVMFFIMLRNS